MYAQLGKVVFENLKGFTDYSKTAEATFAEHNPIIGKPRLEPTGLGLDEVSLSIRLHASFCKPEEELQVLKGMRNTFEVARLSYGNGKIDRDYVITSINESIEDADAEGNVFSYLISMNLKEYVTIDPLKAVKQDSKKNAKAVGNKKPVAKKKTNASPCAKLISSIVTKIDNHTQAINLIITQQGGITTPVNRNVVLHHLSAIRLLVEDLLKRCDDPTSCANALPDLKYRAQQVFNTVNIFNTDASNKIMENIPRDNSFLLATVRNLKAAANTLIQQSITGNG